MLDFLKKTLCVLVDRHETVLVLREGWVEKTARVISRLPHAATGDFSFPMAGLRDGLAGAGLTRLPVRMVIHESWMRIWSVPAPSNASKMADFDAACSMRFQAIFDEALHGWVWQSSPTSHSAFMACAIRRELASDIEAATKQAGLYLVSVEARCIASWNRWQATMTKNAWHGLSTGDVVVLCISDAGQLVQVRPLQFGAVERSNPQWLEQATTREAARLNVALPKALEVCGPLPAKWLEASGSDFKLRRLSHSSGAADIFGVAA